MIWLRGKSMRGRGGGRTRRGRGGSSCDRRCGVFASGDFVWEKSTPACVVVRQLWRGNKTCRLRVSRQLRCPKVSKGRAESPLQAVTHGNFAVKESLAGGTDAPTPARTDGAAAPKRAVLSFDAKESTKESQRHGDYGGGPPRCALFANIGVPGTAVPGPCICSGLSVANCLRQLCPLGTRSLSAQASSCGSPFGAVLVLGSLRSPAGKKPFIAHF